MNNFLRLFFTLGIYYPLLKSKEYKDLKAYMIQNLEAFFEEKFSTLFSIILPFFFFFSGLFLHFSVFIQGQHSSIIFRFREFPGYNR